MPAPIVDAVTAVLVHGGDLYLTRRPPQMAAFPGYWAFPGGKVDRGEADTPLPAPFDAFPPKLMHALIRELIEEAGLDLRVEAAAGRLRGLALLGEATTPDFVPLRFRTWFFRLDFSERPRIVADAGEVAEDGWFSPALLRARYRKGRLLVVPPTLAVIERLSGDPQARVVPDLALSFDPERVVPAVEPIAGVRMLLPRSNTLPPADRTNAILIGDAGARRVLIDPAPGSDAEYTRLVNTLDGEIDEIFLTHHHPDHRERADRLARELGVPLAMSADTRTRIAARTRGTYFEGVEVRTVAEGDELTRWNGEAVTAYAVPGHDEGQLALMPAERQWCLVSDLIQGVGTVVVGGPEGHMGKYFSSMQRVIDWDPAAILPSHGMAMGTTHRIRETLEHRRQREQQVLALHRAGQSPEQMLPAIYPGLAPGLLPLARLNIESHLAKLREENRL